MAKLQNTYEQPCAYCHQDFIPVKRGTQRFCSASCRTTHCKKKKAGTLGRVTKLKGPGRGRPSGSFAETALASATGALAANAVTQTAEYFAVTKGLVQQVEHLTRLVQQLAADQATNAKLLGRGTLKILTTLGTSKAEAWEALHTPFAGADQKAPPQPLLEAEKGASLPPVLSAPKVKMPALDLLIHDPLLQMPELKLE